MAELKFKVLGDLSQLRRDIKKMLNEKFKVNVSGGGSSGAGGSAGAKKGNGLLGTIIKKLGPLAILMSLKPIQDILAIMANFVIYGIIQVWKLLKWLGTTIWEGLKTVWELLKVGWEWLKVGWEWITEKLQMVKDAIVQWLGTAITFLKELPAKIWTFLKELPAKIWSFISGLAIKIWDFIRPGFEWLIEKLTIGWDILKLGFNTVVEWVKNLWNTFKEKLLSLWESIKALPALIWEKIKQGFTWIKDKVTTVWNAITALPAQIWDKMKGLAKDIGDRVKGAIDKIKFWKKEDKVDDAIIKPDGTVIKTNPNDYIIATQNPGGLGGGQTINNFYGVTPKEMVDYLQKELVKTSNTNTRF